jgi:hypothetical protein
MEARPVTSRLDAQSGRRPPLRYSVIRVVGAVEYSFHRSATVALACVG